MAVDLTPAGLAPGRPDALPGFKGKAFAIGGAAIGNVLEWYDFTVYAFLAGIIGSKFFISADPTAALLATFAVFGVGFIARPFGGILIGMFGDRFGRKPTLVLTFGLIAFSTGLIGILPTYATIGLAAPVLLVLARLLQGISAGGEWGGAASFLVEWAPQTKRGLYGSLHPFAITLGLLLGTGVTGALTSILGHTAMAAWGWRLPFLFGAVIGPLGIVIRQRVHETPAFREMQRRAEAGGDVDRPPAGAPAMHSLTFAMCLGFGFPVLQSVLTYLFLGYFPTFGHTFLGLSEASALWSTALATLVMGISCVAAGALSDRIGRRTTLFAACILSLLLAYPLIGLMLSTKSVGIVVFLQAVFAAICGLFLGAMPAALVELFPTARRMFGLTTAYNLQSMLFGGFAPFIASWLIVATGQPIAIAYFIMLAALVSVIAVWQLQETAHRKLA